jgi:hypothetical protein
MWGNEPPHSQVSSHFGRWSPNRFLNFQRVIAGVETHWIEDFFISLESSWNVWLIFDFRPLKVENRPDFLEWKWRATYGWKDLNKGYNFALDLISIGGLHTKLCAPKVVEVPTWEFQDSHLGVSKQNDIWVLVLWPGTKYTIRGKVVVSPSPSRGEYCESVFARGSSVDQKHSNYTLINLLFGLCRSVWVIDFCQFS